MSVRLTRALRYRVYYLARTTQALLISYQVMSPGTMLPTTSNSLASTLPKLALDGSNWIIWKKRMLIFLGSKRATSHIDSSKPPPKEPEPVADGAKAEDIKKYETESEKYLEWIAVDEEVKHWIPVYSPPRSDWRCFISFPNWTLSQAS